MLTTRANFSQKERPRYYPAASDSEQTRREPQRGPGKHSCEAPKHFHGAPLGRKF